MQTKPSWLSAYVDESGTNTLQINGKSVSHIFLCVAVLFFNEEDKKKTEQAMDEISHNMFSNGEIASKNIGKNHERRLKVLSQIKDLPFTFIALFINKSKINPDSGLRYKRSFYKYVNKMLLDNISTYSSNLEVIADEVGCKDFMDSFCAYFDKQGMPQLFTKFEHSFAKSSENRLIQLADLLAGSLPYCYYKEATIKYKQAFKNILKLKLKDLMWWPEDTMSISEYVFDVDKEDEDILKSKILENTLSFIEECEKSSDEIENAKGIILKRLLIARIYEESESQSIYTDELIELVKLRKKLDISEQVFRSKVIGKMRDEGIIISGNNKGYRLALNLEDIQTYLAHDESIIMPMITRIEKAQKTIKIFSDSKIDIYEGIQNKLFQKFLLTYEDEKLVEQLKQEN